MRLGWFLKSLPWLFGLVLALPGGSTAAEFSARMMLRDGPKTTPGRIYVKPDKMRQEFLDDEGHTITIVRKDKRLIWVLLPRDRSYLEMPLKTKLPGQFLEIPPEALSKRKLGVETVNGYATERYQAIIPGGAGGPTVQTFWVCGKLGMPLKMECKERNFGVEYKDIKEGLVPDRLFEVPPGFRKISQLSGDSLKEWD